jgi:RNA polymerase sigma-70 factor (ECF subfamily)
VSTVASEGPNRLYKSASGGVYQGETVSGEGQAGAGWCARLYDEKAASLVLYGRALGLSHGEAEDVLQDTFLALLQLADPPAQPEHYLVRCFRNRALNYRRSLWRRARRELESWRWFEPAEGETPREREAMRCLARLPAEQREVIVLRLWHQFTFASIGQLLGLSPNTVAGRYRYGLQKLRACLLAGPAQAQREALEMAPSPLPAALESQQNGPRRQFAAGCARL